MGVMFRERSPDGVGDWTDIGGLDVGTHDVAGHVSAILRNSHRHTTSFASDMIRRPTWEGMTSSRACRE